MHPALRVPDTLCLIFGCDLEKNDLVRCSLVCRLWGIWASDVLWRTCRVPLQAVLRPLACITISFRVYNFASVPYVEIGNIDERGWRRFLLLSNKITSLDIDCGIGKRSLERIKLARQSFNGEPFLQLQDVSALIGDGKHLTIDFATVPSLRKVHLSCFSMEMDSMCWVFERMPVTAPQISSLELTLGSVDVYVASGMIELSRYSALRYLSVDASSITPRLWESLTNCKLLKIILLSGYHKIRNWTENAAWTVDFVDFPALRTLIPMGNPMITSALILRSRMPMLEYLWWGAGTSAEGHLQADRVAPHLKLYSPKFDTNMLYRIKRY